MYGPARLLAAAAAVLVASGTAVAATPQSGAGAAASAAIVARDYDLGVRLFRQPGLTGRFARMPIRLWGTIAAPDAPGPHPVILVAHGAHGDNCPGEFGEWPCFKQEQRNDLGFRYLVKALARKGFVAFAPDLNAAHTGGWGEGTSGENARFAQVVDATLAELAKAAKGVTTRFGLPLRGKVDMGKLGVLGHSRGGMNVLVWSKGKTAVRSVYLLAPFHDPAARIGNVPATVSLGTCDGDTGLTGAKYFTALRGDARAKPAYLLTLVGANHNFYNQTLVRLAKDDLPVGRAGCGAGERLGAKEQQAWLARVAVDHFTVSMLEATEPAWMSASPPQVVHRQRVAVRRIVP